MGRRAAKSETIGPIAPSEAIAEPETTEGAVEGSEPRAVRAGSDTGGESLEQYLREVSRWSLLTAEAERSLARRIAKGDSSALDDLINRNLRLVVYWAKRYRSSGMPLQDLIQEGNIGLMRAAEKFDPRKGTRFSTYASWWIRQALARAICDKQDLIRIPVHMHQKLRRVDRLLERQGRKEATESELRKVIEKSGIVSFKEWDGARRLQQPISLDRRQDPEREGPIEVEDDRAEDPLQTIYSEEMKQFVASLLSTLPARYQAVLRLRYGLDGGNEFTLEAIGARLRISRERVRQIQTEALERIAQLAGRPAPAPVVTRRSPAVAAKRSLPPAPARSGRPASRRAHLSAALAANRRGGTRAHSSSRRAS